MMRSRWWGIFCVLVTLAPGLMSCAVPQRGESQPTSFAKDQEAGTQGKISQAELQDDLLRFESQFNARIQNGSEALEASSKPELRYRAALNRLIYSTNSLGIALGPSPESNLLDMVAFIELSHDVLKRHWIPEVFGAAGRPLDQAFAEAKQQIWAIAAKVLDSQQRRLLQDVIFRWRAKHPAQINVETVRLSAFSSEAGAKAEGLDRDAGGLFASVQQSTQAVDSARLFAERALYYAERAPVLFRLQARLGADEILSDLKVRLAGFPDLVDNEPAISKLMEELRKTLLTTQATLEDANLTAQSVSTLMGKLSEDPKAAESAKATLAQLTNLLKEWGQLLSSTSHQKGVSQLAGIAGEMDRASGRFLNRAGWLGGGLIALFWILFVLSQLAYRYLVQKIFGGVEQRDQHKDAA